MPLVSMVKELGGRTVRRGTCHRDLTDNELVKVIDESCKKLSIALV